MAGQTGRLTVPSADARRCCLRRALTRHKFITWLTRGPPLSVTRYLMSCDCSADEIGLHVNKNICRRWVHALFGAKTCKVCPGAPYDTVNETDSFGVIIFKSLTIRSNEGCHAWRKHKGRIQIRIWILKRLAGDINACSVRFPISTLALISMTPIQSIYFIWINGMNFEFAWNLLLAVELIND